MTQNNLQKAFLDLIDQEGWIYLIHARETNRYKIGRSIYPILRRHELQKQSPYELEIIASGWTLNTVGDEALLHKKFAEYRVIGEWFQFNDADFSPERLAQIKRLFVVPPTTNQFVELSVAAVQRVYRQNFGPSAQCKLSEEAVIDICCRIKNRREAILVEEFIHLHIPTLFESYFCLDFIKEYSLDFKYSDFKDKIDNFVTGGIKTFALLSLKQEPN